MVAELNWPAKPERRFSTPAAAKIGRRYQIGRARLSQCIRHVDLGSNASPERGWLSRCRLWAGCRHVNPASPTTVLALATPQLDARDRPRTDKQDRPRLPDSRSPP